MRMLRPIPRPFLALRAVSACTLALFAMNALAQAQAPVAPGAPVAAATAAVAPAPNFSGNLLTMLIGLAVVLALMVPVLKSSSSL